jgi:hypothetical protein
MGIFVPNNNLIDERCLALHLTRCLRVLRDAAAPQPPLAVARSARGLWLEQLGTIKYHQAETTVESKLVNKLGTRVRVRGPYRCLIVNVAGFPNRFCILFYSTVALIFHPLTISAAL